MGCDSGYPIFDFQQDAKTLFYNRQTISPALIEPLTFANGTESLLRILRVTTPAWSQNTLELSYNLSSPGPVEESLPDPLLWRPGSAELQWDFSFSDLYAGRYLGMWFPSNLIFDRFRFTLELEIRGSDTDHVVASNGDVQYVESNHWRIVFPDSFSAFSPMLFVCPAREVQLHTEAFRMASGDEMTIEVYVPSNSADVPNPKAVSESIRNFLLQNEQLIGKYQHGKRFVSVIRENHRSMEYDGGATSDLGSLEHEVFHSWFGRGLKPATQNDSWIDEAWTVFSTASFRFTAIPFDTTQPPVLLSQSDPYNLVTPKAAHEKGFFFFAGLCAEIGLERIRDAMRIFYQLYAGEMVTTKDLYDHLLRFTGDDTIRKYFDHFVYGKDAFSGRIA